ncbi:Panacea domain-containing protein [Thorsellia kenyensis]|uniref:Panacea domain-containing protein n=1 Tax=Thorsellia kenyensis TaxID=1549888 RepID=A0ABV6CFC4_9GAMM
MDIHDACDYVIFKIDNAGESLSNLKLQKLLYYIQAWHLVFEKRPMFSSNFQAWVHGPVSKEIFDRFKDEKSLYSDITINDIRPEFNLASLKEEDIDHINNVLGSYAKFSGVQLEEMSHKEQPWINARKGVNPMARSENIIDNDEMMKYYSARLDS